jgi:predicted RNase H-like nuclease (RuvC/YqgF family)
MSLVDLLTIFFTLKRSVIRDMIRLETALDACLERLRERCSELQSDEWALDDDLDSIASSTTSVTLSQQQQSNHLHFSHNSKPRVVRFAKHDREVERLKTKMTKVEQENLALKQQLEQMQCLLGQQGGGSNILQQATTGEEKKLDESQNGSLETPVGLSEGQVWNLVHQLGFDNK